jgi:predicted CXXCH cytochrome family protein
VPECRRVTAGGGDRRAGAGSLARRALALAALAGVASAPLGWLVTDRLERDNDFCNACHLEPDVPLHIDVRRDFDAAVPATLAAAHRAARLESRPGRAFRCIDCHGGHSWLGRVRVKALAAKDSFWYALGDFDEPEGMRWPLWDEDCAKCHDRFDESAAPAWQTPRFHQLAVHNVDLGVACVECHSAHETGGNPDAYFLRADRVRSRCAGCHSEYEQGGG